MLVPDHDNNFSPLELLTGKILLDGSHTKGLLQESLEAKVDHLNRKREMKMKGNNSSGSSSNGAGELLMNNKISSSNDTTSEFRSIMESLGLDALRRGKYILALRFLHLSTNYRKVLETMQRILRLPAFTEVASCGSRNLSSGATFTPGQEPIGGGGAGGGATSTSMSGGAASTTAWTNSFKLRQLEQECRKFLSMYADYGASFGIDVNSSNNSGMVVTNAADHGTRAAQQTTRSSDEITRVWRFVCKLWRLKHFHDCVRDQGRYEEALELFDREEFLSNPDEQMLPGFFSVDYTKILETYISLLTRYYAADHFGNTAGGGMLQDQLLPGSSGSQILRQRLLQVQNFLSKNGHISVSPNARYFMQQLSLK
ncbi:unnamed protein product [Amoebophrya sp. A120]|nr:unnamed protein product [Amoebophrya sp. A120]|eukprot:GSA120T00024470001.1